MFLDGPDRHALVGNLVVLTPGRQVGHEPAIGVGGIDTRMAANFLEEHGIQGIGGLLQFSQPALEPQVAHATAFEPLWHKGLRATGD